MKGNVDSLDEIEEQSIKKFKIESNQRTSTTKSYIEKEIEMLYNLAWIPCTSNACERLFSRCNIIFDSFRQSMLPINMEILLYLKLNHELWDERDIVNIYIEKNANKASKVV